MTPAFDYQFLPVDWRNDLASGREREKKKRTRRRKERRRERMHLISSLMLLNAAGKGAMRFPLPLQSSPIASEDN